jgi:hypothetical protein
MLTKKQIVGKLYNYKSSIDGLITMCSEEVMEPEQAVTAVQKLTEKLVKDASSEEPPI